MKNNELLKVDMLEYMRENKANLNWTTVKNIFEIISADFQMFQIAKLQNKVAINNLIRTHYSSKKMKYIELLSHYFFVETLLSEKSFDLYKNVNVSETLSNHIKNELKQLKLNKNQNKELKDTFVVCLNIAVNSHVDPIYEKYNFNEFWEDVNMANITSPDLIEAIMMEKAIRSTFRLANQSLGEDENIKM